MNYSKLLALIFFSSISFNSSAFADTIYSCIEDKAAVIAWEFGGFFSKPGLKAEANNSPTKPSLVSIVVSKNEATLKGNADQVSMRKINESVFLEETGFGNQILWTVVSGDKDHPTYIFQHKTFKLAGPFSITVAYKCQ